MAIDADVSMPLAAGVERAIPATKSFTCQLTALYLLALYEGVRLGRIDAAELAAHIEQLQALPRQIEVQLDGWRVQMAALAAKYATAANFLYLGRGIHYAIAREGALKLKEASYVHAEGYPAGELKHGPNALVSDSVPLMVLATVDRTLDGSVLRYEKTVQLLSDMKAQGAKVIAIANCRRRAGERTGQRLRRCGAGCPSTCFPFRGHSAATVCLLHGPRTWRGCGPAEESRQGGRREVARRQAGKYKHRSLYLVGICSNTAMYLRALDTSNAGAFEWNSARRPAQSMLFIWSTSTAPSTPPTAIGNVNG